MSSMKQICFASFSVFQNFIALLDIVLQEILRVASFFQTCSALSACLPVGILPIHFVKMGKIYNIIFALLGKQRIFNWNTIWSHGIQHLNVICLIFTILLKIIFNLTSVLLLFINSYMYVCTFFCFVLFETMFHCVTLTDLELAI